VGAEAARVSTDCRYQTNSSCGGAVGVPRRLESIAFAAHPFNDENVSERSVSAAASLGGEVSPHAIKTCETSVSMAAFSNAASAPTALAISSAFETCARA
jgi:hypothetical protein